MSGFRRRARMQREVRHTFRRQTLMAGSPSAVHGKIKRAPRSRLSQVSSQKENGCFLPLCDSLIKPDSSMRIAAIYSLSKGIRRIGRLWRGYAAFPVRVQPRGSPNRTCDFLVVTTAAITMALRVPTINIGNEPGPDNLASQDGSLFPPYHSRTP